MTFDGTTLRLYMGGVQMGSTAGSHSSNNDPLLFGRWTPAKEYWDGLIDEVRVYTGALTQSAIQAQIAAAGPAANEPPTVSLTTPVGGATFVAPATIAFAATAADSDGTVAKVEFFNGTTLVGTDTSSPFNYTWTGVPVGTYALTAVATDNSGATTHSAVVNVTVNATAANVPPTVSMTSPAQGASFVAPATVTFRGSATDSDGTVAKVEFYVGATRVATDTSSPFSATWSAPLGSHSVSAVATDNLGAVTVSAWRDFTVTSTAVPGTAKFVPASPADEVDYYVFEVFAAGADPETDAPIATQNIGKPPVVNGECTADVRFAILALPAGNYVATVSAFGDGGPYRSNSFSFTR